MVPSLSVFGFTDATSNERFVGVCASSVTEATAKQIKARVRKIRMDTPSVHGSPVGRYEPNLPLMRHLKQDGEHVLFIPPRITDLGCRESHFSHLRCENGGSGTRPGCPRKVDNQNVTPR